MFTLKIVHFSSRKYKDGTSPVYLRLTIDRKVKYIPLPDSFKCLATQWDKGNNCFNYKFPGYDKANGRLARSQAHARDVISDLNDKNNSQGFSHDEFAALFSKKRGKLFLFAYFDQIIKRLDSISKIGNRDAYKDAKSQFLKSFGAADIEMAKVTLKDLNLYVEQCKKEKQKDTSISMRLRTLRALYNKAKEEEGLEHNPFKGFNWKQFNLETEKRAISKDDVLKIYNLSIAPGEPGFDSRNYWMFSYFCFGVNFGDLAKLEPGNITANEHEKTLKYHRAKTGKLITVPLSQYALDIIQIYHYSNFGNKYIFPIINPEIHKTPQQIRTRIQTALKVFNREMGDIANALEIGRHLTSYVARHTFATTLKKADIATAVISEMMGHRSESVTQTYLDSFDDSAKAKAAEKLM